MKSFMLIVIALSMPATANAQEASNTSREKRAIVYLRETGTNLDVPVELIKLDTSSVIVQRAGVRRELPWSQVSRIEVTVRDSVGNGALIGALIMGGVCAVVCGQGLDRGEHVSSAVIINAGMGALIGAGLDAMVLDRAPIYPFGTTAPTHAPSQSQLTFAFRLRF